MATTAYRTNKYKRYKGTQALSCGRTGFASKPPTRHTAHALPVSHTLCGPPPNGFSHSCTLLALGLRPARGPGVPGGPNARLKTGSTARGCLHTDPYRTDIIRAAKSPPRGWAGRKQPSRPLLVHSLHAPLTRCNPSPRSPSLPVKPGNTERPTINDHHSFSTCLSDALAPRTGE